MIGQRRVLILGTPAPHNADPDLAPSSHTNQVPTFALLEGSPQITSTRLATAEAAPSFLQSTECIHSSAPNMDCFEESSSWSILRSLVRFFWPARSFDADREHSRSIQLFPSLPLGRSRSIMSDVRIGNVQRDVRPGVKHERRNS